MGLKSVCIVLVILMGAVGAPLMVEAQLGGIIGSLLQLINIQGTVFCTANGNMGTNGSATPIFPNATVQLQCGGNSIVSTTTTNNMGIFSIRFLLSSLLSNCIVVVKTPLSDCDVMLPSIGRLVSPLTLVGSTVKGIINVAPCQFEFIG